MKIVKWIFIVLFLLVAGAVILLYVNLDRIIQQTVEAQGTAQLKVPTTLGGVSLGLMKGTLDLSNLVVGSPQGFSSPQMLSLGGLSVDTGGIMKLRDKPIHIPTIRIDQPKLVIEQSNGKLNFKELMDGLPSHPEQNPPPAVTPDQNTAAEPAAKKETVKLVIDDLYVGDAHVIIHPGIPGLAPEIDIAIPAIDVKNIGNTDGAQNGAAIKDVLTLVITQMATKAAESNKLPPEVSALLAGNLDAVKDKLTTEAQTRVNTAAQKYLQKLPPGAAQPANDLINQGFGFLKQATSQPAKK